MSASAATVASEMSRYLMRIDIDLLGTVFHIQWVYIFVSILQAGFNMSAYGWAGSITIRFRL
jgi:hypothetical protein